MKPSSAREKGSKAELEVLRILEDELGLKLVRNKQQTARGGRDIAEDVDRMQGPMPFAVEVKHHAKGFSLDMWSQTIRQAQDSHRLPVLFWRGNRQKWRVCADPHDINPTTWPIRQDHFLTMDLKTALQWMREVISTWRPK